MGGRVATRGWRLAAALLVGALGTVAIGASAAAAAGPGTSAAPAAAEASAGGSGPSAYSPVNTTITSFDGTPLHVEFYPANGLRAGQTAPTVLDGSFWAAPAYPSWLGTIGVIPFGHGVSADFAFLGPATLTAHGYNVVTWDPRGTYASGGQVNVDSPTVEGRDVSSIIDWVATLPAAEMKGPDYPVVGMTGVSYGGGIQLSAAIEDHRLAAIEPNLSWSSLVQSLYPNQVIKAGWGNLLCWVGKLVGYRFSPELTDLCKSAASGDVTPAEMAKAGSISPGARVGGITTPTLLLGGTVDTLFPLAQDVETYDLLKQAGTPVQMLWYCGGHGLCSWKTGDSGYVTTVELAFLDKYLKHQDVYTGPPFAYQDQTGAFRAAPSYPLPVSGELSATGSGLLGLSPFDSSGFLGIAATPARHALDVPIAPPPRPGEVTSAPTLTLRYRGLGTEPTAPVFAQIVDTAAGKVVDNQATPVRLILDGADHTVMVPLAVVTWRVDRASRLELQLTDASNLFSAQHAFGLVDVEQAQIAISYTTPGIDVPALMSP